MFIDIFFFIVIIGTLVFIHEFGHFITARVCGIGVERFSIGFGKRLIGFRKGITDYYISAIPLGGYVKMVGDSENVVYGGGVADFCFSRKDVFKKILVVLAGPFFNLVFSFFIFFIIFFFYGTVSVKPKVGFSIKGMPAKELGIKNGDTLVSFDGVLLFNWKDLVGNILLVKKNKMNMLYFSSGAYYESQIDDFESIYTGSSGKKKKKCFIGITPNRDIFFEQSGFIESFQKGIFKTYDFFYMTLLSISDIFVGKTSIKNIGGPIMIAKMVSFNVSEGVFNLLFFVGLLSINLAALNCLPVPVLDGGYLIFFICEVILGYSLNLKIREKSQQVGFLFLFSLMLYVFFNDVFRVCK